MKKANLHASRDVEFKLDISEHGFIIDEEVGDSQLLWFVPTCPECKRFALFQVLASKLYECYFCHKQFKVELRGLEMARSNENSEEALNKEFEKLKEKLGLPNLSLKWIPGYEKHDIVSGRKISGEVVGNVILIYDKSLDSAIKTLRHEMIDYAITKSIVEPLVSLVNLLVKEREHEIYRRKEKLVDDLAGLIEA